MAERIPARLTAAEGRKFGLTVGSAFLVFAALFVWRHHETRAIVAAALGLSLWFGALAMPTQLGPLHRAWYGLAHLMSKVTTPIMMGIIYFLVFTPVALFRRMLGKNSLAHPEVAGGYWVARDATVGRRSDLERQF